MSIAEKKSSVALALVDIEKSAVVYASQLTSMKENNFEPAQMEPTVKLLAAAKASSLKYQLQEKAYDDQERMSKEVAALNKVRIRYDTMRRRYDAIVAAVFAMN